MTDCYICGKPAHAKKMCSTHYHRYMEGKRGDELTAPTSREQKIPEDAPQKTLEDAIHQKLLKSKIEMSYEDLSNHFNVGMKTIRDAVKKLEEHGINVSIDEGISIPKDLPLEVETTRIDVTKFEGDTYQFGVTADNHLCSKYYREDVLNALYDIWERDGVTKVLQAGNMIDGEFRFNKFDLVTRPGLDAQAEFLINEWPRRKGITTEFVCGHDHEGWYVKAVGVNIVQYLQNKADAGGRDDMKFVGYMEHDYELKGKGNHSSRMRLSHAGGGSTYAISYTVQKIVESYQPNEKPTILLVGHFHKSEYSYPRAVHVIQPGCTEDQTPFMRQKRLEAMVGGYSVKFQVDPKGIVHRFNYEFHPFYDRDFYKRWKYIQGAS